MTPHTSIATFTCVCSPCFDVARRRPGREARRTSPAATRNRIDERLRGRRRVVAAAEEQMCA